MKVLYDYQIFEAQNIGGISRYFSELLKRNPSSKLSLRYSDNFYLKNIFFSSCNFLPKDHEYNLFFPAVKIKGKKRLFKIYSKAIRKKNNKIISIDMLKTSGFDLFHPTYYNPYFLEYLKCKPFVLTVYDMIHELLSQHFEHFKNDNTTIYKKNLIQKANKIIAISESTKKDLLKLYPELPEEKISVVHLSSSFPPLEQYVPKENYILFTGSRSAYKNFINFIHAVAPLIIKYDLRLICTGQPFNNIENQLLKNLKIIGRSITILASEEELVELYARANIFVFPSLYEGFGIPVLEAFATGCPAILSNTSSLPEVAADAAIYFDPYSIDDMRSQIDCVLRSSSLQNEMVQKGKERLKFFSWEKCADETIAVYRKTIR